MKVTLEIRAAEGGEDSKLFVKDLVQAYERLSFRLGWISRLKDIRPGECSIEIEGQDLSGLYKESGGHRIQRIPPTERKGRVHTSTVTVAIIEDDNFSLDIKDSDLRIEWYSGTGAGGQHRNKHQNSCRITHIPTGVLVTAQCRSRQNSYDQAKTEIVERVISSAKNNYNRDISLDRKKQVGSGMRGDKIRTYRFQDDRVQDHNTGKSASCEKILKGYFDLVW